MVQRSTSKSDATANTSNTPAVAASDAAAATTTPVQAKKKREGPFSRLRRRRKRSTSAPPAPGRRRLLEDHYRVDYNEHEKRVVLPGVPKHDDDWARDSHDFFNLIVLIPVVALNVMNWNWDMILAMPKNISVANAWTGDFFHSFFSATLLYFVVDLLWIMIIPHCVKSPSTIIQHHTATMLYILIPYFRPEYRWCMGACMIVEINTWFLIARRVFNKQGFPPWIIDLSFVSIRIKLISLFFYVTWIGIRCILYPYLLGPFVRAWLEHSEKVGTKWNIVMLCVPLHASFCLLNIKWSYELLMSKIRYWRRRGNWKESSKGL
jgi:hypothetical protein